MVDDDIQNIFVEGNDGYQKAKLYIKQLMPKQIKKVTGPVTANSPNKKIYKELSTSFVFATPDDKIIRYLRRIVHLEDGDITKYEKIKKPNFS